MNIVINPGTEKQKKHNEKNAIIIAKRICDDLDIEYNHFKRNKAGDNNSWYDFIFTGRGGKVDVGIPGINPDIVCESTPFKSPRLYVNGSSWLYGYALSRIFDSIKLEVI